eukprot:CAMPEP_0177657038 /NCGR_PEP_ID=MMETSP0447-20121125/15950_1 /TAXON_ID=0 /ORGANISM="Stygamoeba regulata, Strain BSH-02190019" /LENGTH=317 /DNA_ID=CAMNT_0019161323 /DNA_START=57 /DNA_END=1007 /DNA_ORIENTATION=-
MASTIPTDFHVGFQMLASKMKKMGFDEVVTFFTSKGVQCTRIDPQRPIAEQGDFDVALVKLTDYLVDETDAESRKILENWKNYTETHPEVCIVDPMESQRLVIDRLDTCKMLQTIHSEMDGVANVRTSRFIELREIPAELSSVLAGAELSYPIICKTLAACGSAESHDMGIAFNEDGLRAFAAPLLLQEYVNHDRSLFKVFTLGDWFDVVTRSSLPNLEADDSRENWLFNSQGLNLNIKGTKDESDFLDPPSTECLRSITRTLSKCLGLTLFGFDLVTDNKTGKHVIIDINYFPGYSGVEDFPQMLLTHLAKCTEAW